MCVELVTDVLAHIVASSGIPRNIAEVRALRVLCDDGENVRRFYEHVRTVCTVVVTYVEVSTHREDAVHVDVVLTGGTEEYRDRMERAVYDAFPQTNAYGGKCPRNGINFRTRALSVPRRLLHEWRARVFHSVTDEAIYQKEIAADGMTIQYKLLR